LTDSLNDFRITLTPEATPEQIRLARDKVKTSYDSLASDLNSIAQNVGEDLRTQVDRLKATVGGISNGAKVSDAIDSLKSNTDAIGSSLNSLESELKCQH
jgi:ABC-type transporter Mla subunit MlaD